MATTTEDVIVRYRAEVDELERELNVIISAQTKIVKGEQAVGAETKKQVSTAEFAAKKRADLIKLETSELRKLAQIKKLAFDPKQIDQINQKIAQSQKNISLLKGQVSSFGSSATSIFQGIAAGLGTAFSVSAIVAFANRTVDAFLEAEDNANKLRFAITSIGGEGEIAFERLIRQSKELQETTIFSDDSIQQAQAALAAFKLTSEEIEKLIPSLADFATITSQDIPSASQQIGAALEGNGREFKKYGIEVSATATRSENLAAIMEGLAKQAGAAENATRTLGGELKTMKNRADELEESIGSRLAKSFVEWRFAALKLFETLINGFDSLEARQLKARDNQRELTRQAIEANIAGDAAIAGISVKEEAQKRLIAVGNQLNELEKSRQDAEVKFNEEKGKLFNLEERQSAEAAIKNLETQRQALVIQAGVLADFIKLEKNKADVQQKAVEEVTEAQKKAAAEAEKLRQKEAEELAKNLEKLKQLQIQNIEDLKQRRIAEFEDETTKLTAKGNLRADIIREMEIQLVKDLNKIDEQRNVDPLFRVPERRVTTPDTIPGRTPSAANGFGTTDMVDGIQQVEDAAATLQEQQLAIRDQAVELIGQLTALYAIYTNARIEQIEREKNAQLESINLQEQAINQNLTKRRISEKESEKQREELIRRRLQIEKEAADKERALKRRQAALDKANALIQITINTAQAVSKAYAQGGTLGFALAALLAAAGAAQAAIVIAQPIPYAKGSKDTGRKGHMARVGEQGEEIVFMPAHSKVLPNNRTRQHAKAIDAMFDGSFDRKYMTREDFRSLVNHDYLMPRMVNQKREQSQERDKATQKLLADAVTVNVAASPTRKLEKVHITNTDELAAVFYNMSRVSNKRR